MRTNALLFASLLGLVAGDASAARIYVTTENAGIGTGACSLQEAIYSSVLHDTLDGVHGIAIDATDQGNPPDHFITTGCVMGDGNDTIVLPTKGHLKMDQYLDGDAYNPVGPTATPVIFSTIIIEGNGTELEWTGTGDARLFAVIGDSVKANGGDTVRTPNGTASGVGNLTLRNVYIKGFHVSGGDGVCGGGGGMGAGGAIYVWASYLTVENSTFDGNKAVGGRGLARVGIGDTQCAGFPNFGGGGGIFGNGGGGDDGGGGAGGGGSKGDGGQAAPSDGGGGGGGTVFGGGNPNGSVGGASGFFCGGNGGDAGFSGNDGHEGRCPGGGGGGGGYSSNSTVACGANGGDGNYGGGGGGGDPTIDGFCHGDGGRGGFGGGGGAAAGNGGGGGFGGGGAIGIDSGGKGGYFGASAVIDKDNGILIAGGGAALGGAIFNDGGVVTVRNSTFTNNVADEVGESGNGVGAAIFSHDGSLTVENSTMSGNCAGNVCQSTGGAIVVFGERSATFTMNNTIIANNSPTIGPSAGRDTGECYVQGNVTQTGTGNLIVDNGPPTRNAARPNTTEGGVMAACTPSGVVSTANPELGFLQDNGGYTKTMAIPFGSVAMGAADPWTSLATDQRNVVRPQAGGFDIGAFEVCRRKVGAIFEPAPCAELAAQEPPISLTILASSGGMTEPAAGSYDEQPNTVVALHATANDGFYFKTWAGNVVAPKSASTTVIMNDVQVVQASFQQHDFALSLAPDTISFPIGGVGSSAVTAFAFGDFADKVTLSMSGVPTGITKSLSSNPVAPTAQTSVSSILTLTAGASAMPQTFTVTVTGNSTGLSGALTRKATLNAALVATAAAIVNVIGQQQALGCIDQSGIVQSLTSKMNTYQMLATGGHAQGASNVLAAFQYEVQGQIGHHIVTTCTDSVTGTAFSAGDALIADAQSLQATLATPVKGAPIVGSVVSTSDAGTAGRAVNLLSGKTVIATASTDAVGFYYLDTTALKVGAQYGVSVTIPKGYKASSPASQTFTWTGKALQLAAFTLN